MTGNTALSAWGRRGRCAVSDLCGARLDQYWGEHRPRWLLWRGGDGLKVSALRQGIVVLKRLPLPLLLVALLTGSSAALAAPGSGGAPRPLPPGGAQAAPAIPSSASSDARLKFDADGDRLFEDLEQELRATGAGERLDVIVRLHAPASAARVRALERGVGHFGVRHRYRVIDGFAARMNERQIGALARNPVIASIEEDSVATKANDGAQDAFAVSEARLDHPPLDGSADGNVATYSAVDLVAAVIDTGIDVGHQDLNEGKVIGWRDIVNGQPSPYDDDGHGTHVAGTIAGDGDARPDHLYEGVAPGAALVGVKVLDRNGNGTEAGVIAGIDWAVANRALFGIEAINISLGIAGCSNGADALSNAANNANAAGIVTVVAAGNEGGGTCTIGSPAAATGVLTVGNMVDFGASPPGYIQNFSSSRGPTADGRVKPDVSAPGTAITSAAANTSAGYVTFDGTSMATPFTTGVSLLMRDANAGLTTTQVKDRIKTTAIDWARGGNNQTAGTIGQDIDYGFGRLDAYAAIRSAGAPINSPPLLPVHLLREGTLSGPGAQVDFALNVTDTTFPIAATMLIPAITSGGRVTSPDFDMYLLDPNGNQVASSVFQSRQEEFGFRPTATGTYTLRVVSFRGSGQFFVDVSHPQAPAYARPASATPLRVPLVPAFAQCSTPTTTHVPPLSLASCRPPVRQSSLLKTSAVGRGSGFLRLSSRPGNEATPGDEADIDITLSASDVLRAADGTDYTGQLVLRSTLRMTDRANGFFANEAATATDVPFSAPVSCVGTPGLSGGSCSLSTSADTLVPGTAREGKRAVISAVSVALLDRGPDATITPPSGTCPPNCGSGDEQPFLHEGVFTP